VPHVASADERLLAARMAAGDEEALAEVYDGYADLVFGVARRVTGDRTLAEDVTQEVFVQLWNDPGRFDPTRGGLRCYLGVLAHRRAVDAVRGSTRRQRREARAGGEAVDNVSTWGRPEVVLDEDVAVRVRRAITRLPELQQEALRMAYYGGRSYRDVAKVLGIPEGTAKSRLRSGLANLSDLLGEEGVLGWT
jgi:RNA polymerase sigma-70 factor (ECF subfamily)